MNAISHTTSPTPGSIIILLLSLLSALFLAML